MRAHLIVMASPFFDQYLRFGARTKPFEAKTLGPHLVRSARRLRAWPRGSGRFLGRLRGNCSRAVRHSRCTRPGLMASPSRSRKIRMRRYPERGYCADSSVIRSTTGASFVALRLRYFNADRATENSVSIGFQICAPIGVHPLGWTPDRHPILTLLGGEFGWVSRSSGAVVILAIAEHARPFAEGQGWW